MGFRDGEGIEFDTARMEGYLKQRFPDLRGAMTARRVGDGQSNPTFTLDFANQGLVLRKQPPGDLIPGAHAIDREFRVQTALAKADYPVPPCLLFEDDRAVCGTPFYIMEKLEGRVFADSAVPGVSPEERSAIYDSMNDAMAKLHAVDPLAIGLAGYGKPGDYFARQIARWTRTYQEIGTRPIPEIAFLANWLPANQPAMADEVRIAHGDFRVGNMMIHPTEPRVIGVLDWELSTLGHPLADVGFNVILYHTKPTEYGGILGLDREALGIPDEAAYMEAYRKRAGRTEAATSWHIAFALFRFAVIFETVASRVKQGNAAGHNAAEVMHMSQTMARRGQELALGQPHDLTWDLAGTVAL